MSNGVRSTSPCAQFAWRVISHPGSLAAAAGAVLLGPIGLIVGLGGYIAYRMRSQSPPLSAEGPHFYRDLREQVRARQTTPADAWAACLAYDERTNSPRGPFIHWLIHNPHMADATKYYVYNDYRHYGMGAEFQRAIDANRYLTAGNKRFIMGAYDNDRSFRAQLGGAPAAAGPAVSPPRSAFHPGIRDIWRSTSGGGAPSEIQRFTREKNKRIYQDTRRMCHRYKTPEAHVVDRLARLAPLPPAQRIATRFAVVNTTTRQTAQEMVSRGLKPLVLDAANRYTPGGGVKVGSNAQEEILMRQSNGMVGLEQIESQYPLPETGGALVRGVTFFRQDPNEEYALLDRPFVVDVFASAAYNCNEQQQTNSEFGGYDRPHDDRVYMENTKEKMRTMFRAAIRNGNDSLVLGAFGCGAFANNPVVISRWYREVLNEPEFLGSFREVVFGIVDDGKGPNFETFRRAFGS